VVQARIQEIEKLQQEETKKLVLVRKDTSLLLHRLDIERKTLNEDENAKASLQNSVSDKAMRAFTIRGKLQNAEKEFSKANESAVALERARIMKNQILESNRRVFVIERERISHSIERVQKYFDQKESTFQLMDQEALHQSALRDLSACEAATHHQDQELAKKFQTVNRNIEAVRRDTSHLEDELCKKNSAVDELTRKLKCLQSEYDNKVQEIEARLAKVGEEQRQLNRSQQLELEVSRRQQLVRKLECDIASIEGCPA